MAEFPHPDLIQSGVKQATQGNRYQFYAGACYLLYASTAAMQGASGLTVKFFTSENPDADGGDELKAVLPAPSIREDAPDLYFPHGLYIEVEGVNGNSDVALVEANWVARADYCRAYPQVAETLTKCWSETRPDDPFLSKFDEGAPDDGDWDNEGAAGSGGVSGAPTVISSASDPTVNDDSGDGYSVGDLWVNTTDDGVFVLADATAGAAVWTEIGSGGGGGAASWGSITGTLSNQTDLQTALDAKLDLAGGNMTGNLGINVTGAISAPLTIEDTGVGDAIYLESSDAGASASPCITMKRDSASPAAADYIGQLKFKGESSTGSDRTYAKITAKIGDPTDLAEDGIIEFSTRAAGTNRIALRLKEDSLRTLNGVELHVDGNTGLGTNTPSEKLDVVGNIAVSGTVDGRDVATDGTKLDGIEALADVTDATNVNAAGAVMESDFSSAKTILVQQSGTGSPETLAVDQNTLVGRTSGASSSIDSLTATEVRSLINVADGAEVNPAVPTQAQAEDVSSSTEYSWTPERVKNVADVTPRNESMVYVFTVSSTNFPASANVPVYMAEQNETIDSVYVVPSHASSGSSGSNNWAIDVKKTGGTSLCSTVYNTSTSELAALTPRTLGVDQNNTLGAEDVLYINVVKTGTPTSYQHKSWTFVVKTRKTPAS